MGGPSAETHFEAWGEAMFAEQSKQGKVIMGTTSGIFVLFAVAETKRRWLGWYIFSTDYALDLAITGSTHELIGEKSKFPSHFITRKPMPVNGLCGTQGDARRSVIIPTHLGLGDDVIEFQIAITSTPGPTDDIPVADLATTRPIHLYIRRKQTGGIDKIMFGWTNCVATEPFGKTSHLDVRSRIRALADQLIWMNQ